MQRKVRLSGEERHERILDADFDKRRLKRRGRTAIGALVILAVAGYAVVLIMTAATIKEELYSASRLLPRLQSEVSGNRTQEAKSTGHELRGHTLKAREAASNPLWVSASGLPFVGSNFHAASVGATAANDVTELAVLPLIDVYENLDWTRLLPGESGPELQQLVAVQPKLAAAAHAVSESADRLNSIDAGSILPQVAEPLRDMQRKLDSLRERLTAAADGANVAPNMLGAQTPRHYLLMIQNNAEVRATGGIPGALAVLTFDDGKLSLGSQISAASIGPFNPPTEVDPDQVAMFSNRLGIFMQDVNLTPDFPTSAGTAQQMWEKRTGDQLDGVISVDPVALGYILSATGPVQLTDPDIVSKGLPTELSAKNVVSTLLSEVYSKIPDPLGQDAYFAGVAREIFGALSEGHGGSVKLLDALAHGVSDGRIRLWSSHSAEQDVIGRYALSGAISGPSTSPAQFGVYFNDGTGAKMDYHVKRTVQLLEECSGNEYSQIKVRVTSTNTVQADAASTLPAYVTGGGAFGVPAGSVQTNVIAYGPGQANVEAVHVAGRKTGFASQRHSGRPVGSVTVRLAPGQSSTVEFTFGKIVQHADPVLAVTPTVQAVKDVVIGTETPTCPAAD